MAEHEEPAPDTRERPAGDAPGVHDERVRLAAAGWPPTLVRASDTPGEYAAFTHALGAVRFASARDAGGGWVYLATGDARPSWRADTPFPFPNGVEVRLDDLRWVAEDPADPDD